MTSINPCPMCKCDQIAFAVYNNAYCCICPRCSTMGPAATTKDGATDAWNQMEVQE